MKIRTAIIGFGKMGLLHGALLGRITDVELISIVDKSKLVLHAFKSMLPKVSYYNSYEELFSREGSISAVVIATPVFSHLELVRAAIKRDVHFFVEKPLCRQYKETDGLLDLLDSKPHVVGQVGFVSRFMPTFRKCKEILDRNAIGYVRQVTGEMYVGDVFSPQKGWRYDPKTSGGGVLIDFAIHLIDLLYWLFGDVTLVSMEAVKVHSIEVEDEIEAEITFKRGFLAYVRSSWSSPNHRKPHIRLDIVGETGNVVVTDQTIETCINDSSISYSAPDYYSGYFMDIGGPHFSLQMEGFFDAIKKQEQSASSVKSAIYVQKIITGMYRSAQTKHAVPLD